MRAQSSPERSLDDFFLEEVVIVASIETALKLLLNVGRQIPDPPPPPGGVRESLSGARADPSA